MACSSHDFSFSFFLNLPCSSRSRTWSASTLHPRPTNDIYMFRDNSNSFIQLNTIYLFRLFTLQHFTFYVAVYSALLPSFCCAVSPSASFHQCASSPLTHTPVHQFGFATYTRFPCAKSPGLVGLVQIPRIGCTCVLLPFDTEMKTTDLY